MNTAVPVAVPDPFHHTLEQVEAVLNHFITGNPGPYKAC